MEVFSTTLLAAIWAATLTALKPETIVASAIGGVIGNRFDAALGTGFQATINHLKKGGKPVNHDLQKAVKRSYLFALQSIASECHDELTQEANYPGGYLLGHRADIQWLSQKGNDLAKELKEVDQAEYMETPIEHFQEIELLLTPEGKLAEDQIQAIKQRLLAEALKDGSIPSCYKAQLEHTTEGLFERMCAYFAFEIKNNQVVRAIFEGELLAQINVNLQGQRLTIENLEVSLRTVAQGVPQVLEKLDNLEAAVQEGNYKLDQRFGDVLAVVTPSAANIEEIKALLEQLIKGSNLSSLGGLERQQYENIPRSGVVEFVGRSQELETLHQQLQQQDRVAIAAIAGMGGIGKTELAIQYARRHLQTYLGGVCWLQARSLDIGVQIVRFGRSHLDLTPGKDLDLLGQVEYCWGHWPPGEVLVVLDDVTDYNQVEPYLPPEASRFKVLVTTRLRLELSRQPLILSILEEKPALCLLWQWVGEERISQELVDAKKLCQRLGYLPLALQLVGRYVKKRSLPLAEMLRRLEEKGLKHKSLVRDENDPTWTLNVERGVAAAFELSWEELSDKAKQLGCLLSLFALASIPWSLVEGVAIGQDPEDLEDARVELESLSLLQGEGTYRLHQLIREFFQGKLTQSAQTHDLKRAFAAAMVTVAQQIPQSPTRELIIATTPSIPHITEVATGLTDWLSDQDLTWPFIGLGRFYEGQGFYDQAKPWRKQCLSATQTRFGIDHPDVAQSLNNLALLYKSQGRYSEAEPLYVQALELRKRLLGEEHPDVANSLNNLAALYDAQGRYSEAEPLYIQALELYKRLLGEEHPDVATILNNLAALYRAQGRYSEAEPLLVQALELRKRLLGEEHPDVANSLNNLATLYRAQGRYSEAEPLYIQALELRKRLLGQEHPDVATSLNNLAFLYKSQGRYGQAEPLYVQALAIRERRLGTAHPHTIQVRENLEALRAALASEQGSSSQPQ